jgi:hypothetical protein
MRQTRVAKRRPRPTGWPQTPLPPDPRDRDIVPPIRSPAAPWQTMRCVRRGAELRSFLA